MVEVTGLSGNEIYCINLAGYDAGEVVLGNSVISRGFWGSLASGGQNFFGGEVKPVTEAVQFGRSQAFDRMVTEAERYNASGVAGVVSELSSEHGHTEFIFVGSCVNSIKRPRRGNLFTSAGDAQELYCHNDAGYQPIHHAFGNIAYSVGLPGLFSGGLKTLRRGEVKEFSDVFNQTRHAALNRLVDDAKAHGANAVVGIRTEITDWMGTHEMLMTGTGAKHAALPAASYQDPVTSDLTGEELWAMAKLGYAPVKLLLSTSIFSLGIKGAWKSAMQAATKRGELTDLTKIVYEAKESAFNRLKQEANALGADKVVGVRTHINEFGNLTEYMVIGTAVKKMEGMSTRTAELPAQAIIRDKTTWIGNARGFSLE